MTDGARVWTPLRIVLALTSVVAVIGIALWILDFRDSDLRGEALGVALQSVIEDDSQKEQSLVAKIILTNYFDTRANAARWSGIYWGCTFFAAILSALAALVLKIETLIKNEGAKKDIAALLAVTAALLVTISTSGDFQRKWQANRVAAGELERTGYLFLENNGVAPRTYLAAVGDTLLLRQLAIAGGSEKPKAK